jgi:hypothetical protein
MLPPHEELVALSGGSYASALATFLAAQHTSAPFTIAALGYIKSATSRGWKPLERIAAAAQHPLLAIRGVDQPDFWAATLAATEAPAVDTRALAWHQLLHTTAAEAGARVAISGLGAHLLTGTTIGNSRAQPGTTNEQEDMLGSYAQALMAASRQRATKIWSRDATLQKEEPWEDTLHARKLARRAGQFQDQQQGLYYLDLHLRLPDQLVGTVQQLAIQEQMAVRSPYLDASVLDMLTRLPAQLGDGIPKGQLFAALAQRYYEENGKELATLPLLAPSASLARLEDSDLLHQTLSPEALRNTGIFDPQAVEQLVQQGTRGKVARELLLVFTTQLLCQLFGITSP